MPTATMVMPVVDLYLSYIIFDQHHVDIIEHKQYPLWDIILPLT